MFSARFRARFRSITAQLVYFLCASKVLERSRTVLGGAAKSLSRNRVGKAPTSSEPTRTEGVLPQTCPFGVFESFCQFFVRFSFWNFLNTPTPGREAPRGRRRRRRLGVLRKFQQKNRQKNTKGPQTDKFGVKRLPYGRVPS